MRTVQQRAGLLARSLPALACLVFACECLAARMVGRPVSSQADRATIFAVARE